MTFIIPVSGCPGEFLIGHGANVAYIKWTPGNAVEVVKNVFTVTEEKPGCTRFNDAKCDPKGRLFAGTMGLENPLKPGVVESGLGSLYRIDERGTKRVADKIDISNGLAWNSDGTRMYFIDSLKYTVDAFDYDLASGDLSNRRAVFDIKTTSIAGIPDGMTIDNRGHLWVALFNGSKVNWPTA